MVQRATNFPAASEPEVSLFALRYQNANKGHLSMCKWQQNGRDESLTGVQIKANRMTGTFDIQDKCFKTPIVL